MKRFLLLAWCFAFAVAQVARAGDGVPKSSATAQRVARPVFSTRAATVNASQGRIAGQPNWSGRRAPQVFPQQTHFTSFRNPQTRQVPEASRQRVVANTTSGSFQGANSNRRSYFDALRRYRHERHDCNWWRQHFATIAFANYGYYYCDQGYWYPAFGYDPANDSYDYDGPIYTYGDLSPDQVIANVQSALQEEGYYLGEVTGSFAPATRAAIARYQVDHGLIVTGAIDEPTVEALGLK
jgi:hypothetical protein